MNKNIDKNIFKNYETVETAFNNDLRAFDANGRVMKARALKGESYHFKSDKTGKKYDISAEQCRILNLLYNTYNALNEAQRVDNMMSCYNGNAWWFERAELRRKVKEMVNDYIDAFEAWLDEKDVKETVETIEVTETAEKNVEEVSEAIVASSDKRELSKEEIDAMPDFKPLVGYEGLYEVGKDGSVWSLNYRHTGQRKQLRPAPFNKYGHLGVGLCKDRKQKTCKVHQLVLSAYLPKPSDNLEVLHKNSTASDNRLNNLKWGTHKENNNDPRRLALQSLVQTNHPALSTPVVCVETGVVYPSVHEAERQTGINQGNISDCINDKRQSAGGYHWARFVGD